MAHWRSRGTSKNAPHGVSKTRNQRHKTAGFTLVELMAVCGIFIIVAAIAVPNFARMMNSARINDAVQVTLNQLRMAHEEAVDKRLVYIVTFDPAGSITTQWIKTGFAAQPERTIPLPGGVQFLAQPGLSAIAAPDGFGTGTNAIDFDQANGGGSNVIFFQPDGTALDAAGNPNNGVVYLSKPGDLYSSRAISLFGATGRLKSWTLVKKGANPKWQ